MDSLSADDFRDLTSAGFLLSTAAQAGSLAVSVRLELTEVREAEFGASPAFRAPFSLLFQGPLTPALPQGIYSLLHQKLGLLELFIVPLGPGEAAAPGGARTVMRYEVTFG